MNNRKEEEDMCPHNVDLNCRNVILNFDVVYLQKSIHIGIHKVNR